MKNWKGESNRGLYVAVGILTIDRKSEYIACIIACGLKTERAYRCKQEYSLILASCGNALLLVTLFACNSMTVNL